MRKTTKVRNTLRETKLGGGRRGFAPRAGGDAPIPRTGSVKSNWPMAAVSSNGGGRLPASLRAMSELVRIDVVDSVATLTMDDGKANALSHDMLTALASALEKARTEAKAVVLTGRDGRFCAGFDLKVMMAGPAAAIALTSAGCDVLMRLYEHPQPVVAACTGHAMAGGALLLLCCDTRIGIEGDFRIGLNEVAIGMPLPVFASELARERLRRNAFLRATLQGHVHSPSEAADVGFLDRVVAPGELLETARSEALALAKLPVKAYASTKRSLREPLIAHVRATYEDDVRRVMSVMTES